MIKRKSGPKGGTPVGSTFWKRWMACRFKWFLVYIKGVAPRPLLEAERTAESDPLGFGSAYHELQEHGEVVSSELACHAEAATKLYKARGQPLAPPMAPATGHEVPFEHKELPYTTRIDRMESESGREFKTQKRLYDTDVEKWNVDLEVLGELVCSGAKKVTVDIITKEEAPRSRQVEVALTPEKRQAFEDVIAAEALNLTRALEFIGTSDEAKAFPRTGIATACSGYVVCEFYNYCWGAPKDRVLKYVASKPPQAWRQKLEVK